MDDDRVRKTALYEQFARVGKALANPTRLELLDLLAQGERSVEDLAGAAGMKVSNTSAQLRMLAAAGLVTSRRDGVKVYYRLADPGVSALTGQGSPSPSARISGSYDHEETAPSHAHGPQRLPLQHGKKSVWQILHPHPGLLPAPRVEPGSLLSSFLV